LKIDIEKTLNITMEKTSIIKKTSNLGALLIKIIPKETAKKMIIRNHYSHKWGANFGVYNFGLFRKENPSKCLGVASYGYMKNAKAKIFMHPNKDAWMCELNRMWISDELGKNAETLLIGASLRLLKRLDVNIVAVQSFADGRLGCGTIYKASNFKYYGFHYTKFLRNKRTGEVTHEQNFTDTTNKSGYLRANISYLIGDLEVFEVKTYRYIYPMRKGFIFIKSKELPYPAYEKGERPVRWIRNTFLIKDRCCKLIHNIG